MKKEVIYHGQAHHDFLDEWMCDECRKQKDEFETFMEGGDKHFMRDNMKFLLLGAAAALFFGFLFLGKVGATQTNVTICHATGNGWQKITVDDDAVNGQGNGDHNTSQHQNGQDIIPPGYWDNNGRNWDATGQAIWNNNCNVPVTPTVTPTPTSVPSVTPTPTPYVEVTPTPTPFVECEEQCEPTPSPSPEPTQGPGPAPSGDGKSDGRSDGRSSCPECTLPPTVTALAPTGDASRLYALLAGMVTFVGGMFLKRKV